MAEYMGARDLKRWAKEQLLDDIDVGLGRWYNQAVPLGDVTLDDLLALRNERNRVAKFLGFPPKNLDVLFKLEA